MLKKKQKMNLKQKKKEIEDKFILENTLSTKNVYIRLFNKALNQIKTSKKKKIKPKKSKTKKKIKNKITNKH